MPRTVARVLPAILTGLVLVLSGCAPADNGRFVDTDYEVWMTDQNNTAGFSAEKPRGTNGGRLMIYKGADLEASGGPKGNPEIIDLAELYAVGGPNNPTGAGVERPHMSLPSPDERFMALSFVASGHVAIIEGATRKPKGLFRMSVGADGKRQAHAAFWAIDGSALLVANQNGKMLERINYDPATDGFVHDTGASINLVTCTTPNGIPCQSKTPLVATDPAYAGPNNRPDNAPICPIIADDGNAYVTLRGGGMFVVDMTATPMAIVGEYGTSTIGRDGCGGLQRENRLFFNGGTGTVEHNPTEFRLYQLPSDFPDAPKFSPPNTPAPIVFYDESGPDTANDAHGMAMTRNGDYLWQFDRLANEAKVFDARQDPPTLVNTVNLVTQGVSDDPTPDLVGVSPSGSIFLVALRGPKPQTGAHAADGTTPGLGIVEITDGGKGGRLIRVLRTTFPSPLDGSEESDPHGAAVRLT